MILLIRELRSGVGGSAAMLRRANRSSPPHEGDQRRIACLKVIFLWLELDAVISISPFPRLDARIRLPKRLPRNLTDDEVRRLRRTAMDRVGLTGRITETKALRIARRADADAYTALVVLEVLLCTGLRVGELVSIRVPDIDLIERVITIMGKGSRLRRVFLPDDESAALVSAYRAAAARRGAHDRFVVTASGAPGTTQFVRALLRGMAAEAEVARSGRSSWLFGKVWSPQHNLDRW